MIIIAKKPIMEPVLRVVLRQLKIVNMKLNMGVRSEQLKF